MKSMWRVIREAKGLTLNQVAKELNITVSALSQMELGISSNNRPIRMSIPAQIYYLELRADHLDMKNAEYLREHCLGSETK